MEVSIVSHEQNEIRQDQAKCWLYWLAGATALVGMILLIGSVPAPEGFATLTNWPATLAPAGSTLIVGALAGAVALTAAVSWRRQRERQEAAEAAKRENDRSFEVWRIRAGYYDKIAVSAVLQFVGGSTSVAMAEDRGRAVLWGSADVVKALEHWDVEASKIRAEQEFRGYEGPNSDAEKGRLWKAFTELIQAMRSELPDELKPTLTDRQVLRAVFSDYRDLDDINKLPAVLNHMS